MKWSPPTHSPTEVIIPLPEQLAAGTRPARPGPSSVQQSGHMSTWGRGCHNDTHPFFSFTMASTL